MQEISLEQRKQMALELLDDLVFVCQKHNIDYYLAYGTLLGAIRHKGFIPWDDDIDVWIPADQYEKLLQSLLKESKYTVKNHILDNNWYFPFSKLSNDHTLLVQNDPKHEEYVPTKYGVSIDMFPLFRCENPRRVKKCQTYYAWFTRMFMFERNLYHSIPKKVICKLLQILHFDSKYYHDKYVSEQFKQYGSNKIGFPLFVYKQKDIYDASNFGKAIATFEGKEYVIPSGYDTVLTTLYGDYMTPPPKEKQISNHNVKVYKLEENDK